MSTPLSCNKIKSLIESVRTKRAIWDKADQNHHNGSVLTRLWQQVAADCDVTVFNAKGKWKRLRESFGKRYSKFLIKSFSETKITVEWPYFKSLMFLKDQFSFPAQEPTETFENFKDDETFNEIKEETKETEESKSLISLHDEIILSSSPVSSLSSDTKQYFDADQSDNKSYLLGVYAKNENSNQLDAKEKSTQNEPQVIIHEDVSFFNSIAPYIQVLTPKQKMQFRIKVLQILDEMLPDCPIPSLNSVQQ